ncbi:hypothetical protein TRFO_35920 [Tritrichomonas foetus]|uniref:Uncharacterized protein n=1 Tax=Tritrichomonas foetus TaxID=1144522 RepID=A0A1J4JJQ6_9EUKA|nr:hypothetical protein TRFO_35920 [Tritrichomonas foetus]|eukprot:OHS97755.1 hypothetical protein TRFO_35920 [Tritrichomonas foetus]
MIHDYKIHLNKCLISPRQSLFASMLCSNYENELEYQNKRHYSFLTFNDFLSNFDTVYYIDHACISNFIQILVQCGVQEIPKETLFDSFFLISLINSITEIIPRKPRDREISDYLWALSAVSSVGYYPLFGTQDFIYILLFICYNHKNFYTTILHTIACLNHLRNYPECFEILVNSLPDFINWSKQFENSQARVKCFELIVHLSVGQDDSILLAISKLLTFFALNSKIMNDVEGSLIAIDQFLDIKTPTDEFMESHLSALEQAGFLRNITNALFQTSNSSLGKILNIIEKISTSKFNRCLIDQKLVNGLYRIMCEGKDEWLSKCFNILITLIKVDKNIFMFLKNTKIFDMLPNYLNNSSFFVKNSASCFVAEMVCLCDADTIFRLVEVGIMDFLFENEEMSGFANVNQMVAALKVCIDTCTDTFYKSHFEELLQTALSVSNTCL